jgi:hypothetical protein
LSLPWLHDDDCHDILSDYDHDRDHDVRFDDHAYGRGVRGHVDGRDRGVDDHVHDCAHDDDYHCVHDCALKLHYFDHGLHDRDGHF